MTDQPQTTQLVDQRGPMTAYDATLLFRRLQGLDLRVEALQTQVAGLEVLLRQALATQKPPQAAYLCGGEETAMGKLSKAYMASPKPEPSK